MDEKQQEIIMDRIVKRKIRHKGYYNKKKAERNLKIKDKCEKIFDSLDILGAIKNIDELNNYLSYSKTKFKCKCFDILFDINESIDHIIEVK